MRVAGFIAAALAALLAAAAAHTVEIKGKVTNQFAAEKYRQVEILVTDRLGVELGRAHADERGRYELKISGPRYVILKALLEGYPTAIYQVDTQEIKESTEDREENRVFAELRTPTYFQNVTFGSAGGPATLEDLLLKEDPAAVKAYRAARTQKEAGDLGKAAGALEKLVDKYPAFYIGYIDLGMVLAAQGQNDRAVEVFTKAGKLRPEHSWSYIGLGVALNNKQDYQARRGLPGEGRRHRAEFGECAVSIGHGAVQARGSRAGGDMLRARGGTGAEVQPDGLQDFGFDPRFAAKSAGRGAGA